MKSFPIDLRRRLCEESHVRAVMRTFDRQIRELQPQIDRRRSSQTSVDFLLAAAKRPRASTRELSALEAELAQATSARARLETIGIALAAEVEQLAEAYVRGTDDSYLRGLGAFSDPTEWDAGVERFASHLASFLHSLGETRAMAAVGYDRASSRISPKANECIDRSVAAAQAIEEETNFLNAVIDWNVELIKETPIESAAPQRLPVIGYAEWARGLRMMGILDMQREFHRVIAYCEDITRLGIPALRQSFTVARAQVTALSRDYILSYVGTLREFSDSHWFKVSESERVLEYLEKSFGHQQASRAVTRSTVVSVGHAVAA
jgi:hypothetical protein